MFESWALKELDLKVYPLMKLLLDIICSLILLILLSPLFLVIAIVIKIDSNGPVFFKQQRLGRSGEYFTIYKFRSMKVEAPNLATDELGDPTFFVTRVGSWMRKTSVDELPQLINIVKGDMSFIGPRPSLYNQYELNKERIEQGITNIRPGITGYAQIMGRDFITDSQKVFYDKYYLENLSLSLDIKILFHTAFQVLRRENIKMK